MFSVLQNTSSLTFRYPSSVRLSHATAKNKAATADEEESPTQSARPAIFAPPTIQRPRSVTSTVADSQISKNIYRSELYPGLVACIEQLSNTMVWHGQHRPQGPHPNKPGILPPGFSPAQIQHWAHQNPHTRTVLEHLLNGAPDPSAPSDQRCVSTPHAAATLIHGLLGPCRWATHLRGHPENLLRAIWSNSLRMSFISSLVRLSVVPNTHVSLGQSPSQQIMRSRPIRPKGRRRARYCGSKVRLSWGRQCVSLLLLIPLFT